MTVTDDPYAWLEDVHGAKPLAWVKDQNARSLAPLKADPRYQKNYDSILQVMDATDRIPMGSLRHGYVYNFWQDAQNPKGLWRRTTIADYQNPTPHWDVLLDIDALAKGDGENWVFKGTSCAPDGRRCLVSLSRGGGDAVVVREFDLASRSFIKDGFLLAEAKSDATWLDDDTILYATAKDGETSSGYARIVQRWQHGTVTKQYEGEASDVLVSPTTFHVRDGNFAVIVRAVSFFESEYFLSGANGWWKLPVPRSVQLQGLQAGQLLFTLREDWTPPDGRKLPHGALVALALDGTTADRLGKISVLFAPGPRQAIESVSTGRDKTYVTISDNVIGSVHVFGFADGRWSDAKLDLPGQGTADTVSTNDYGPEAMYSFENYLAPPSVFFDGGDDHAKMIKSLPARFDASGMVSEQFEAVSKDGTKIPYFVTRPKNLSGPAPTILYGYGGFEVSLTPSYSANFGRLWLSHGGIYVVANIRGGGEFGPIWHEAAVKTKRQHAYDDFEAVAADLTKRGLTTPRQLGIMGGSNGGLLVSTVMVQKPELFGAVVCQVPLIDMIAYTHIGAGASWIGEYGDPAVPAERDYILTYSPYQNVKAGVRYPPVFFVTATSDDRVSPVHARKMAAKMEALGADVMFYENTDGGHAAAADHRQAAEMWGLSFVYLAEKLGLKA
ncbi:MAG TPA: prolyl oligopeptidase family serine peptidase [Rhizomicrobium sp.]|nr:prolyl oligopeptidase family serine peptidase [Rhizomicrobium sp.]